MKLYSELVEELRRRSVTRSSNNPVADYAEMLAIEALHLCPANKSSKGYDATDQEGRKFEIKGRRLTPQNQSRQLSAIRDLQGAHFSYLVGVLFDQDFSVLRGCVMPRRVVERTAVYRKHSNAWILQLSDSVWKARGVRDITSDLKAVERQGDA